jgi:hypothetical protein
MKKHTTLLTISLIVLLSLSACQETEMPTYNILTTYSFDNVDYNNQTIRLEMMKELATYARSANTPTSNSLSATVMIDMYNNQNTPFSTPDLNTTSVQLKNKVAIGFQDDFEIYMSALATVSLSVNQIAVPNQAGIASSNDGTQHFLLNENGVELSQIIEKGIATTSFYYQSTVIYLGDNKMNGDNRIVTSSKGTNMEHSWDEAFGYFGAPTDFPGNIFDLGFWAESSNKVNSTLGCNSRMMNAFLKGRAAISAKDYDARDEAIETLKKEWEITTAAVAISYLNDAKVSANDPALCYHYLTEAYAFITGLKYGASKTISDADIDTILTNFAGSPNPLQANFYNLVGSDIDNAINAITNSFTSLEQVKASL